MTLMVIYLGITFCLCCKKCGGGGGGKPRPGPDCPKLPEGLTWVQAENGEVPKGAVGASGMYVGRKGYNGKLVAGKVCLYLVIQSVGD